MPPYKLSADERFRDVQVGGDFIILTDFNGRIMESKNGEVPKPIESLKNNFAKSVSVGNNFAFVIGETISQTPK